MKIQVFYYKSDMQVRLMRFSILCTPTDSSVKYHSSPVHITLGQGFPTFL